MNDNGSIFVWSLILAGCILLFFVMAAVARRRYFKVEEFPKQGFTMADLRQLHKSGQMSAEEFEKAKAAMLKATDVAGKREGKK